MSNKERNNNTLILLGGLAAGTALGLFLNSKKGRKLTKNLADQGISLKDDIIEKGEEITSNAKGRIDNIIESAKDIADDTVEKLKSRATSISSSADSIISSAADTSIDRVEHSIDQVESAANSLKKGVKKAQAKLNGVTNA